MATATELGPRLGIAPTCTALALPRATYYRRRRPRNAPPPGRPSPRALSAAERGALAGAPKKRGPVPQRPDPRDKKIAELERETARWRKRAERAEALVEVQKKVAALLGTPLEPEKS